MKCCVPTSGKASWTTLRHDASSSRLGRECTYGLMLILRQLGGVIVEYLSEAYWKVRHW
jgi:hypothetical protein